MTEINNAPAAPTSEASAPTPLAPEAAQAQYRALVGSPAFQQRLNNGHAKPAALDEMEALAKQAWPDKPGQPAAGAPQKRRYEIAASVPPEERAAVTALAEREVALAHAGDAGQNEVDALHEPRGTMDYSGIHHGAGRQLMFEAGISPIAANYLASQAGEYSRLDDAGFDAATDRAIAFIAKQPGGAKVIADAKAFLDKLPDNSPLLKVAVMASSSVVGIQEMARLARRGARAAH